MSVVGHRSLGHSLFGKGLAVMLAAPLLVLAAAPARAQPANTACSNLAGDGRFAGAQIASARLVPADPAKRLPAFCEVKGTASPTPGSRIGVVYRLPEAWNGKLLGIGGGGWAGDVALEAAAEGLTKGYAVAETDGAIPAPMQWT